MARDAARADLCRLLAACYYEPGPEWAEEGLFASLVEAAAQLGDELHAPAQRLAEAFQATPLQELLIDHARLFLGPGPALARPYASVWLSGRNEVMQESTLALAAFYAEAGFEVADDFHELPDHVAAELECLYLLLYREGEARAQGDGARVRGAADLRRRFVDGHLGPWLGPFLLAIREGAQTDFHAALAELTERFIALEVRETR